MSIASGSASGGDQRRPGSGQPPSQDSRGTRWSRRRPYALTAGIVIGQGVLLVVAAAAAACNLIRLDGQVAEAVRRSPAPIADLAHYRDAIVYVERFRLGYAVGFSLAFVAVGWWLWRTAGLPARRWTGVLGVTAGLAAICNGLVNIWALGGVDNLTRWFPAPSLAVDLLGTVGTLGWLCTPLTAMLVIVLVVLPRHPDRYREPRAD